MNWIDVNARARGLSTHPVVVREDAAPADVERAVRERAARELRILARWAGARRDVLAVVFDDEDRRTLRGVLRGVAAVAPAPSRIAGAVPTPSLPARLIEALARAPTAGAVAALLAEAGHPYAACAAAASGTPPDLLAFEAAAARRFAERVADRAAAGGRALESFAADRADIDNATSALLLAERGDGIAPGDWFVGGGRRVSRAAYTAAAAGPPAAARARLAAAFARTALAAPIASGDFAAFERAVPEYQLAAQTRWRRLEPHGAAPILWLVLQRRLEAMRLRRTAWRRSLVVDRTEAAS